MKRLGVIGGTFDPPHIAHLILAECARDQLKLDCVLWIPAADPPHKQGQSITSIDHRIAMVRIAVADNPTFVLSLVDVQRPGPHYTADTLSILAKQYPSADLFFLIGADSLRDLPTWHAPGRVIAQAWLGVAQRSGVSCDLADLDRAIPGLRSRVVFVDTPIVEISASYIRARLAANQSVRYLLPLGVESYIKENQLYRMFTG